VGRPKALTSAQVDKLVAALEKLVDEADADFEVTREMVMKRARVKACSRVVADALHKRGYYFRDLREKPILTPEDVKARFAWARKYRHQSAHWWRKTVHIHLDNHMFKVATTARGRKLLAKRRVRGVYRKKGKSLRSGHVKPSAKLKLNTGAKGILKAGGVGGGRVLVWHTIEGRWSGKTAERFYTDVVRPALKHKHPSKKSFCILEDNDPTGNTSGRGIAAKKAQKLSVFKIPVRSPDLNVLDYAVWSEVERRMRLQERSWKPSKTESRDKFAKRLDRTAKRLPAEFINKAIGDMKRRCGLLYAAKGGLFEEGGRSPKKRRPL